MGKSNITAGLAVLVGISASPMMAQAASLTGSSVNVVELTSTQIRQDLAAQKYRVQDLVSAYQARIDLYNPTYNAFTYINPFALQDAAAADAFFLANNNRIPDNKPLFGVPVVIKDSMNIAGVRTTGGYTGFTSENGGIDMIALTDSPIVARLKDAGAIILGKTNLPRFARSGANANTSYLGPTFNSYNINIVPGGSSTGTATAVSASFAAEGTAEETGGSIQNPAGAQALVGIKPTFGLVPTSGGIPLAGSTRDVFGPNSKSVTDAANFLSVIAGYDPSDPLSTVAIGKVPTEGYAAGLSTTSLQGKRFGLFGPGFRNAELAPETKSLYDNAVSILKGLGAEVVADPFAGTNFNTIGATFSALGGVNTPYDLTQWLKTLDPSKSPTSVAEFKALTGIDLLAENGPLLGAFTPVNGLAESVKQPDVFQTDLVKKFMEGRDTMLSVFRQVLTTNNLDGLFFPQQLREPGALFGGTYSAPTVPEINLLGTPQVNLPGGYYASGTPFSVAFLGDTFTEASLLNFAYAFEQETKFRVAPNLVIVPESSPATALLSLSFLSAIVPFRRKKVRELVKA
ncbi:MAG: amidase [Leptolyngbyaceae cyanobacterium bins.59]|nr:amidase [Leptolyngbyaceae cyanobacterium bins.59]